MLDQYFSQSITLLGTVSAPDVSDPNRPWFTLSPRLGGPIRVHLGKTTSFQPLMNLDRINRDRYRDPQKEEPDVVKQLKDQAESEGYSVQIAPRETPASLAQRYLLEGNLVSVQGIYQRHVDKEQLKERFEARTIFLLQQAPIERSPATPMGKEMAPGAKSAGSILRTQDAFRDSYLQLAREMMAFWNLYFLDRENQGIFFRVTENGLPVVLDGYAHKAGHSIAGYHAFELNFLAHIYLRSYLRRPDPKHQKFTLYFHPAANSQARSINVLPDFFQPGTIALSAVTVNGRRIEYDVQINFQVPLKPEDLGAAVIVEFQPIMKFQPAAKTEMV